MTGPILTCGSLNRIRSREWSACPRGGDAAGGSGLSLVRRQGANQAVAMARLGARVQMAGRMVATHLARLLMSWKRRCGCLSVEVDPDEASGWR